MHWRDIAVDMKRTSSCILDPGSDNKKRKPTVSNWAEECVHNLQELSDENLVHKFEEILPTLKQIQSGKVAS